MQSFLNYSYKLTFKGKGSKNLVYHLRTLIMEKTPPFPFFDLKYELCACHSFFPGNLRGKKCLPLPTLARTHTHKHTHISPHRTHAHANTHTHTQHSLSLSLTKQHTHTHTHTHIYIHIYTHTKENTHTHSLISYIL